MGWFDDLFSSADELPSIDLSDAALDYTPDFTGMDLSDLGDLGSIDTSGLFDTANWGDYGSDFGETPLTDYLSGGSSTDYLSWLLGGSADNYGLPQSDGLDILDSASSNVYDPTAAMSYDPVATESLWERLNMSPNMSIDPTTTDNSTAALLQQLTNNTPVAETSLTNSDPMNTANWGLYEPSNATDFSSKGMLDGGLDTGSFDRPSTNNFVSMMAKLLAKPAIAGVAGRKSNLSNAIGALGGLASVYGALNPGKSGAAPTVNQSHTKKMSWNKSIANKASGGPIGGTQSKPRGALGLLQGTSPGQLDDVPINASHGEYVFDADSVSALGDGNTEAGAARLDEMRKNIRTHKRSAPANKIPPKAKRTTAYLPGAK